MFLINSCYESTWASIVAIQYNNDELVNSTCRESRTAEYVVCSMAASEGVR